MKKLSMEALGRKAVEEFRRSEKFPVVLILDNVRSAMNVGSLFRTADAFLIEKMALCGITAQPPHREILKTALGSTESVDWAYFDDACAAIRHFQERGFQVIGVEQTSEKIWLQDFSPTLQTPCAFVLGNEVDGVSDAALALCDAVVEIPQFGTKHSLNVSVAGGIILWETVKKMMQSV